MASKRLRKLHAGQKPRPPAVIHDRRAQDVAVGAKIGTIEIDDPYEVQAKILAFRNLRDDPLAAMHDAGQVDRSQYDGGRHWQRAYDVSELGCVRAIDPTREAVDGGRMPELLSDARLRASAELAKARAALGQEGEAIVNHVLGRRMNLTLAAACRGMVTQREKDYLGRRFRECLETLAVVFGYAMEPRAG